MKTPFQLVAVVFWVVCASIFFSEVQRIVMQRLEHGEAFLAVSIVIVVLGLIAGVALKAKART